MQLKFMNKTKIALFPGSFDPFHKGHESIVQKATELFDKLYVVVTYNPDKDNIERIEKNFEAIKNKYQENDKIVVLKNYFDLTADLAHQLNAKWLVRSARNQTDFNYELKLATANNALNNNLETIIIMPDYENSNISSTQIRQQHKEQIEKAKQNKKGI